MQAQDEGSCRVVERHREKRKESMRDFAIKRRRRKSAKRKLIDCLSFRIDEVIWKVEVEKVYP